MKNNIYTQNNIYISKLSSTLKLPTQVAFLMNLCQGNRWRCMFSIKSTLDLDFFINKIAIDKPLWRVLCNVMIQPFFDCACSAWHPSLRKNLQKRLQDSQNKCISFRLQLGKTTRIGVAEFREVNRLNINDRFSQCVLTSIYQFFNSESLEYFNEIYFPAKPSNINTQSSFHRLKQPLRKQNKGLNSASYSGPSHPRQQTANCN